MRMFRCRGGLLALVLMCLATSGVSAAPAGSTRFAPTAKAHPTDVPIYAKPGSGRVGPFPAAWLQQPRIEITLPDGRTVLAVQQHVTRSPGTTSWMGKVSGTSRGMLALTAYEGLVAGTLVLGDESFELRPRGRDGAVLYAVDASQRPGRMSEPRIPSYPLRGTGVWAKTSSTPSRAARPGPAVIETVVMFTAAARAQFGDGLDSAILNAIHIANTAYMMSDVVATLDLRAILSTTVTEG